MTSIAGGFTFGFVGRIGGSGDDGDRGAATVWASYAADAGLLPGLNKTAAGCPHTLYLFSLTSA